jgi:hypothetical protein
MPYLAYIEDEAPPPAGEFYFFLESNLTAYGTVTGTPVTERALFEGLLATHDVEDFESFTENEAGPFVPIVFTRNGIECTVDVEQTYEDAFSGCYEPLMGSTEGPLISDVPFDALSPARFNTTPGGSKWMETPIFNGFEPDVGCLNPRTRLRSFFTFDPPIAAFGAYGTDWSDFTNDGFKMVITDTDDITQEFEITNDVLEDGGNLFFVGFVDQTGRLYKEIRFETNLPPPPTGDNVDYLGFDDIVMVPFSYVLPP